MKDIIRVGIIGVGNMGTAHAQNLTDGKIPGMKLTALADIDPEKRKIAAEKFQGVSIYPTGEDMYKSEKPDMVIIAVPHYDHPPLAELAFSCGINVLIEKPAGVYTKQVLEMNEAAKKSGKLFGIMYNQRTNPYFQKIREMVQSGELGHIKRISWIITDWYRSQAYHESALWRSSWESEGGGTLINQNPHQLDLWQWMFGMPDRITAKVSFGKYYDIEVEDDVTAYFEYNNGTTGTYITSTGEAPGTNRLEIACDMGKLVYENNSLVFWKNKISEREFNKTNTAPFGIPECEKINIEVSGSGEQHIGILKDYAKVLTEGGNLLAPGYEGICGLTISNAIHYSAWTNSEVTLSDFPHDDFYKKLQELIKNSTAVKRKIKNPVVADLDGTF